MLKRAKKSRTKESLFVSLQLGREERPREAAALEFAVTMSHAAITQT